MKKEYTKNTYQTFNESMEPTSEAEEFIRTSLIADTGKKIRDKQTGVLCVRVDIGSDDSEENYEEVDDPVYTEVIDNLIEEVSNNDL